MAVDKNKIVAEATRYVQKGQYDKALRAYEKILAEDKKEVRTLLKIGEIQQKKGDGPGAAATFNQVAEIYGEQGFFLKAVAVYKQIAKLTPDDVRVNEKLAGLYQQLGLLNDATNQLQVVASAHERAGDQGRHLDVLRRLLDLDPENVVTCQRLGDLYAKANRATEALELYRRAAAHLRENRRSDEYLKLAERIYALTPGDLALARELAQEYLARGDTKKALGKLQVCHGADKQDADTLRLMAQAFRDLGQVSKTIAVYRALARVYAERGRRDEAALTWQMVLELLPDDPEAKDELAASAAGATSRAPAAPAAPPAPPRTPAAAPRPPPTAPPRPVLTPSPPGATPVPGGPGRTATPAPVPPPPRAPAPPAAPPAGTPAARPAPGAPAGPAAVARILTETDVYLKYGLHQKALDHVVRILDADPENPDALERVRDIRDTLGDRTGAAEAAERTVRALLERGDETRIAHATERLRQLDPSHAEVVADAAPAHGEAPVPAEAAPPVAIVPPPPEEEPLPPPDDEPVAAGPSGAGAQGEPALAIPPDEDRPGVVSGPEGPAPVMDDEAPAAIGSYVGVPIDEEAPPADAGSPPAATEAGPAAGEAGPAAAEAAPADELPALSDEPSPAPPGDASAPAPVLGDDSPLPVDDTGLGIDVQVEPGFTDELPLEVELEVRPDEVEEVEEVDAEAVEVTEPAAPHATPTPPPLPIAHAGAAAAPGPKAEPEPERAWEPLDAELDEVEFYERQGLLEEALLAVRELAEAHPGHPAVAPLLERIEGAAAAAENEETSPAPDREALRAALAPLAGAAPPPVSTPPAVTPYPAPKPTPAPAPAPTPAPSTPPRRPAPGSTGTTGIFDLGAELSAELGPELTPTPTGEFQYSVADVFDQFKKGLEKTVRPDDSATKYDLGIAFQEMGMLDEALEQFRSALAGGDRRREVEILSMIGTCLGLKGQHAEAIDAYRQALASEFLTGEAAKALHFELGVAHEAVGEVEQAVWYFQKVAKGDPSYRGVAERVARLGGGGGVAPTSRGAHGPGAPAGKKPRKR